MKRKENSASVTLGRQCQQGERARRVSTVWKYAKAKSGIVSSGVRVEAGVTGWKTGWKTG